MARVKISGKKTLKGKAQRNKKKEVKKDVSPKKKVFKKKISPKKKKDIEKEFSVAPRLRLEPRLTPSPSKRNSVRQDSTPRLTPSPSKRKRISQDSTPRLTPSPSKRKRVNHDSLYKRSSICFEENRLDESTSHQEAFCEENLSATESDDEKRKNRMADVEGFSAEDLSSFKAASPKIQSSSKTIKIETNSPSELNEPYTEEKNKCLFKGGLDWNERERMELATALLKHGFSDIAKIAECLKTKNENDIQQFLVKRRKDTMYDPTVKRGIGQSNKWMDIQPESVSTWPNIRKWRKLAYEQMLLYTRSKDYSRPVLSALFNKFIEEEKEPADPQVFNVKLIYKYLMDCMSGAIPPQLPPKESALVLDLLREVRSLPLAYDLEEERKFLQDFRSATTFKPFQIKDEFKKRFKKEGPDDVSSPNTIAVPEEIFSELSQHKRLVQSFSPLVTPVWMLQNEQEILEKYAEESNVFVS